MTIKGAYDGITVLDFTQGIAGPHASMLLALHGADVIKVEPPEGDWGRALGELVVGNPAVAALRAVPRNGSSATRLEESLAEPGKKMKMAEVEIEDLMQPAPAGLSAGSALSRFVEWVKAGKPPGIFDYK